MLTSAAELARHLGDPDWIVFDCRHDLTDYQRGALLYAEGHVPGAFFAPVETALSGAKSGTNGRHPLPSPDAFAAFLNQHGATPATQLVGYDDVGGQYAARLWWLARWIGHDRVSVLDGGFPAWLSGGFPISAEIPSPRGRGTIVARPDPTRALDTAAVELGTRDRRLLVLDARSPERFRGEVEPIDRVAGRIPTAQNRFFKTNLNSDLTLRPAAELRREFEAMLGGRKAGDVVHQCGSGVTACVNLLAMEHAGLTGSKLYPGSWSEWISDPARPIERG
jgi:thiosulfate/3-mercaptopyruvate sulfurtransferase